MFSKDCIHCLCKTCARSRCRYQADICFARCRSSARAVTFCNDYSSRPRRQIYFYRRSEARLSSQLRKMSLGDLLRLVGDMLNDTK